MKLKMLLFIPIAISTQLFAQQKIGQMALSEIEELTVVVRYEDRSVVTVLSEIPDLEFESTRQIIEIRKIRVHQL